MKNGRNLLALTLSLFLLMGMNRTVFGSNTGLSTGDKAAYELFSNSSKVYDSSSYTYKGAIKTDIITSVSGKSKTKTEITDLDTVGKDKRNSFTVSTGKINGVTMVTETLAQAGRFYTRTFKEEEQKPKWIKTDAGTMLQGDIVFQFLGYAINNDTSGLTYSYGKSKVIDNVEHTQLIISLDNSFAQKIMAPMTEVFAESLTEAMGTKQLGDKEKAFITSIIAGLYKNVTNDIKISCYINPKTLRFRSISIDGSIQMNWLNMGTAVKISGDFHFYDTDEPVTLPVIKDEDISTNG